nr:MAG: protein m26 [Herpesviridae sp.]
MKMVDLRVSCREFSELLEAFENGMSTFVEYVSRSRGCDLVLAWPLGYTLILSSEEDIILTKRDLYYWRMHPFMSGELYVLGTVGHRGSFVWDRRVVAINGRGVVYSYEMYESSYIARMSDSLRAFAESGVTRSYVKILKNIREFDHKRVSNRHTGWIQLLPTCVCVRRSVMTRARSRESVRRDDEDEPLQLAKIPSEHLRSEADLGCELIDEMFKSVTWNVNSL